ncbi:D-alanyl-D-alanine carboxypeptidase (penicillin-binding protein 5/6) [Proteiniborus sp. DW1]|uniref:D-alanyl-D-alanine carboxypeptidase family protein n=1 Tax=Proteiniborus sp. DW1 TaxID=1889883 RepID=UPI00092DF22E|nr:D-alanyl-D-alanine carboxypeptidase family protein [Proteiniborus sp. DW1]SCG81624.1 D-alanyl-D-alanine carboxypeptidase (penicillin-binding protein 5/6) [Proteiniborus sp. DW1]
MKKRLLCIMMVILLLMPTFSYGADLHKDTRAVLLGEFESGEILYEYSIDTQIEVASMTKIMTYLVAMDQVSTGKASLDDVITISQKAAKTPGSSFKLEEGEKLSLKVLLESIMIVSANDSCVAIAEHISGSEEEFVKLMNRKAKELGLEKTKYFNSSGYPLKNDVENMMSTRDLFKLTRYVIEKYPQVLEITKMNKIFIDSRDYSGENTNPLLNLIRDVDGFKTGFTDKAGRCLITTIQVKESERNKKPFRLIGIVMGTKSDEDRKNISKELIEYGLENYYYRQILDTDVAKQSINIVNAKKSNIKVFPKDDLYMLVKKGERIQQNIIIDENIVAPVKAGTVIGKVIVSNTKGQEHTIDLIVRENIQKKNILDMLFDLITNLF